MTLKIPAILLEGDQPVAPPPPELPRIAELAASAPPVIAPSEGELPEAYGTGRLFLTPRDPRCLCAHWDLTTEQLRFHKGRAAGQHLVLRVCLEKFGGMRVAELHMHPESRHWFIHVDRTGATYVGELGYYMAGGQWHTVAISEPAATPVEAPVVSEEDVRFARFELESRPQPVIEPQSPAPPVAAPAPQLFVPPGIPSPFVQEPGAVAPPPAAPGRPELRGVVQPIRIPTPPEGQGTIQDEAPPQVRRVPLTSSQQEALWDLIGLTVPQKQGLSSAEISELVKERAISSMAGLPEVGVSSPAGIALGEITSPAAAGPALRKAFWFNVNAELIIYGATEPDAQVTIGDRTISLRPDGTFSYRFALPDGAYSLPITATALHGDQRRAELSFYRGTRYSGAVGVHPQDPDLKAPAVENIP